MSHTNNYAKYDPYVADIAAKVDAILEQYNDILGNVQIPFNVGQAMVKAHERGDRSKFELELEKYRNALTDENSPWRRSQHFTTHKMRLIERGKNMTSWFKFSKYVKDVNDVFYERRKNEGARAWQNIQVVYYSIFD